MNILTLYKRIKLSKYMILLMLCSTFILSAFIINSNPTHKYNINTLTNINSQKLSKTNLNNNLTQTSNNIINTSPFLTTKAPVVFSEEGSQAVFTYSTYDRANNFYVSTLKNNIYTVNRANILNYKAGDSSNINLKPFFLINNFAQTKLDNSTIDEIKFTKNDDCYILISGTIGKAKYKSSYLMCNIKNTTDEQKSTWITINVTPDLIENINSSSNDYIDCFDISPDESNIVFGSSKLTMYYVYNFISQIKGKTSEYSNSFLMKNHTDVNVPYYVEKPFVKSQFLAVDENADGIYFANQYSIYYISFSDIKNYKPSIDLTPVNYWSNPQTNNLKSSENVSSNIISPPSISIISGGKMFLSNTYFDSFGNLSTNKAAMISTNINDHSLYDFYQFTNSDQFVNGDNILGKNLIQNDVSINGMTAYSNWYDDSPTPDGLFLSTNIFARHKFGFYHSQLQISDPWNIRGVGVNIYSKTRNDLLKHHFE